MKRMENEWRNCEATPNSKLRHSFFIRFIRWPLLRTLPWPFQSSPAFACSKGLFSPKRKSRRGSRWRAEGFGVRAAKLPLWWLRR
jgi:hypothetical protein